MRSFSCYTTVGDIIKVVSPSWDKGTSPITSRSMTLIHLLGWSFHVKRNFSILCTHLVFQNASPILYFYYYQQYKYVKVKPNHDWKLMNIKEMCDNIYTAIFLFCFIYWNDSHNIILVFTRTRDTVFYYKKKEFWKLSRFVHLQENAFCSDK